jgi:hypothetical protein
MEYALGAVLRALQASIELARHVAARAREHNKDWVAKRFEEKAREAKANAESLRNILMKDKAPA